MVACKKRRMLCFLMTERRLERDEEEKFIIWTDDGEKMLETTSKRQGKEQGCNHEVKGMCWNDHGYFSYRHEATWDFGWRLEPSTQFFSHHPTFAIHTNRISLARKIVLCWTLYLISLS